MRLEISGSIVPQSKIIGNLDVSLAKQPRKIPVKLEVVKFVKKTAKPAETIVETSTVDETEPPDFS